MENAILPEGEVSPEARRLLDAALELIRHGGTRSRPRVADIVAEAGLSNDAFYRHFPSKDDLVAALITDGARRLARHLAHQMGREDTAEGQVRRWAEGILSQARGETGAATVAVQWNSERVKTNQHDASETLAGLLRGPFADLGSDTPELDASLTAHAVVGTLAACLARREPPDQADTERIVAFCLRAASR
ncbi:MAG: TetR/AcrR family transcriptional regulator [Streptosporangiales bacterium]|nr:TetR/AcrR family transcriptional regulator [Streptosporangiales bacterium]